MVLSDILVAYNCDLEAQTHTHQLKNQINYGNMSKYSYKELLLHKVCKEWFDFLIAIKLAICFEMFM